MSATVLVAYATRYGSTQEVAEAIAATLREGGLALDLEPARQMRTLGQYRAVVLGAPLYIGAWHKDAVNFLARHRQALAQLPTAIFALGPTHADEQELQGAREQFDKERSKFSWLAPVAIQVFGGKYDPAKLRFPDSLLARLPASPLYGAPASDARDWAAIRAWGKELATKL